MRIRKGLFYRVVLYSPLNLGDSCHLQILGRFVTLWIMCEHKVEIARVHCMASF